MSYEFTVARPFTMPKGNGGQFAAYVPGQKITDQSEMNEIAKANGRNVVRHFVTASLDEKKPAKADPAADAPSDPEPAKQPPAAPAADPAPVSKPTVIAAAPVAAKN